MSSVRIQDDPNAPAPVQYSLNMEVVVLVENANRDESLICWICRGQFGAPFPEEGDNFIVDCCNCGDYKISKSLRASRLMLPDLERYRFSFWQMQQQLERRQLPILNSYTIDGILAGLPNPPEHAKPGILLRSLSLLHPKPGKTFTIDTFRQWSLAAARDMDEMAFHVRTLVDRGDLKQRAGPDLQITGPGWARIGQMSPPTAGFSRSDSHTSAVLTATASKVGTEVASHGQLGGITAHTVNVSSPPLPEGTCVEVRSSQYPTISLSRIIERSNADAPRWWEASSLLRVRPLPWPVSSLPIGFVRDKFRSGAVDIKTSGH
ncbi:MAG: hypothetical protein QOK23_4068 [Gammaproteobacteria bacterium]|nr:hypothetical protein [Gammaproteobacteria bacterium]